MENDLAAQLAPRYQGNIVHSGSNRVVSTEVEIAPLSKLLIKVKFRLHEREIMFRALLSERKEGLLILIRERVTSGYILSGISGFLYDKPNVHGGLISKIRSFYFHIVLEHFDGIQQEIYFLGKNEKDYLQSSQMKSIRMESFY